jgi:hypothetical protein
MWEAGVLGFACVLAPSGSRDFPPLSEADLRSIMPGLTRIRGSRAAEKWARNFERYFSW